MGIVARQSIKAAFSNYIGILLGFLNLFLLFPLFFTPRDLGAIRLLLESGAVISSFALLGTNYSINRYFPYFKTEDQKHSGFFFWALLFPIIGFTLVLIGLLTFKTGILGLFGKDAAVLTPLYPMLIFLILFSLFQMVLEATNANHGRIAFSNFLREVVLRVIILGAGILFYKGFVSFEVCVWIMVGAYSVIVILNYLYLRTLTKVHFKPDFHFLRANPHLGKDALRFTAYLFVGGVTSLIVGKIDFLMISVKKELSDTAIYSIGFYLALLIEIPKRTILQIAAPIFSQRMKENDMKEVGKMYSGISLNQLLVASILFYMIWVNIDNLFQIMPKGEYYKAGKMVVFIIGIGRLIDMIGSSAGPVLNNSKYYYYAFINLCISVLVAVSANWYLIPRMGINGAALATIFTFLLSQGMVIYVIWKKLKIHPFCKEQLYIILLLGLFLIPTYWGKWFQNAFIDGAVRSIVLCGPFVWILYKLKVSVEFNNAISKFLARLSKAK